MTSGRVRVGAGRAGCIDPGSTDLFTTFAALGQLTRARSHLALDTYSVRPWPYNTFTTKQNESAVLTSCLKYIILW